ncbi:XdhC/CoxI family protein [Natrarchaeobius halalkaliphilus]|uniref:XdhC/CoxI family protein n=1 Tax=Natrarchaeobius halalkaliphilus TaxID=1679091 RepID=A0A3N6LJ26_9EURY|nr:XdhC family protein [Natrarchaeobius halalkaliphilus]RQG87841.1 XdhC/CoxI family protein [Natrarchaeobius halalkaliphilus]
MDTDELDPWSATTAELYRTLRARLDGDDPAVLATIVDVDGSAYRRQGAKMIVVPGDDSYGSITAGCLEGPVVDLANAVLDEGRARVETFDLMNGDEWGLGLGCNGVIDILLEPLDNNFGVALDALANDQPVTVLTAVESSDGNVTVGDRTVLDSDLSSLGDADRNRLPSELVSNESDVVESLRESASSKAVQLETSAGTVSVFVDHLEPVPELLLFGNQNDVHPVARIGREAGFRVVVASSRGSRSDGSDFPYATRVVSTHPTEIDEAVRAPENTYAVLMSHNFLDDRLALETLLEGTSVPYVGLMGPRKRFEEMQTEFEQEGVQLSQSQLERVSTPVGLDLGSDEPIQIALSIVSETLAVHNDRNGGRLKCREGPIHERVTTP